MHPELNVMRQWGAPRNSNNGDKRSQMKSANYQDEIGKGRRNLIRGKEGKSVFQYKLCTERMYKGRLGTGNVCKFKRSTRLSIQRRLAASPRRLISSERCQLQNLISMVVLNAAPYSLSQNIKECPPETLNVEIGRTLMLASGRNWRQSWTNRSERGQ